MPTYDYRCDACGHEFDAFHSIMDAPLRKCPKCRKQKLRRLIGAGSGIIFKGSGFYETDYKRARAGGGGSSEKSGEKGPEKSPEKSGESGGEKKAERKDAKKSEPRSPKKGTE